MQTYVVSNLLRTIGGRVGLLFCMLVISSAALKAENPGNTALERDSLFVKWNKSRSTLPTLIYKIKDFDDMGDRVEVESLIRTYGIGGVIIGNGEVEEVSRWINENSKQRGGPLIHGVEITTIFELPFKGLPNYPGRHEVECLTRDHLVYLLGQTHAFQLKKMGIGIAEFTNIPVHYSSHEVNKLKHYVQGLTDGGIRYFFSDPLSLVNPALAKTRESAEVLAVHQVVKDGLLGKKSLKKYRKEKQDNRPVIDFYRNSETAINQIDYGVTLMVMSGQSASQNLVNAMLLDDIPDKSCYKKEVKAYFDLAGKIDRDLKVLPNPAFEWNRQQSNFKHESVSLIQDQNNLVPIRHPKNQEVFTVSDDPIVFESRVDRYRSSKHLPTEALYLEPDSLLRIIPENAVVLVDFTEQYGQAKLEVMLSGCKSLSTDRSVIILGYNNELTDLIDFPGISVLFAPEPTQADAGVLVEMAFGARAINGALPGFLSIKNERRGEIRSATGKLIYEPAHNLDQSRLDQIDQIVSKAIADGVMPGCQIMMVKDGRVVYDQNFGYHTYDSLAPVHWDDLYDIASVTKTVATLPLVMKEVEQGGLSIYGHLGDYLPAFEETDKADLELGDLLTHQSGLKSYIPFWRRAKYDVDSAGFLYKERIRRNRYKYQSINWSDSIQSWIADSRYNRLSNDDGSYRYLYSDLGFMVMKDIVEANCACAMDQSLDNILYQPMGMDHTLFNPLRKYDMDQIAPTEQDKHFRSKLLQGVVHDKNAALLGGVSGHAGLFSNANDLAKYMYMMLHGGQYGGIQFFEDSVINAFTSRQRPEDRRALGWDKPNRAVGNASRYASNASFGHSGFTGTLVWADPNYDLIYIFLSNRIYPDPQNYKLIENNTRTKIHDLMYESFLNISGEMDPGM